MMMCVMKQLLLIAKHGIRDRGNKLYAPSQGFTSNNTIPGIHCGWVMMGCY